MPDREKVIKGLECCTRDIRSQDDNPCYRCPYDVNYQNNDSTCMLDLKKDALALLKAQEPRVMTLEEVKQWCETHPHKQNPIWVEFQHGYGTDGWRVGLVNSGLLSWCKDKEARCWTSHPTDEQREAIPWG